MKPKKLYDSYKNWHFFIIPFLLLMLIFRLVGFTSADMRRQVQDRHQYSAEDLLEAVCEYQSLTEDERKDIKLEARRNNNMDKITDEEYDTIVDRIDASEELERKRKDIKLNAAKAYDKDEITRKEYNTIVDRIDASEELEKKRLDANRARNKGEITEKEYNEIIDVIEGSGITKADGC